MHGLLRVATGGLSFKSPTQFIQKCSLSPQIRGGLSDQLCQALGIEHRLTQPRTPQTNGMVEGFNGRLRQVLRSHHLNSAEDLEKTLHRFVWLYNRHLPQKALGHTAPVQALKDWKMKTPIYSSRRWQSSGT